VELAFLLPILAVSKQHLSFLKEIIVAINTVRRMTSNNKVNSIKPVPTPFRGHGAATTDSKKQTRIQY
jgi:hypothetical protein